jgi:hypothetical protein
MALTIGQIQKEALGILEKEFDKAYTDDTPYSLVQVALKDGTTQEIMLRFRPRNLHDLCDDIRKHGSLTLTNEESGIYVPAHEIKHINVMKVTKEQP